MNRIFYTFLCVAVALFAVARESKAKDSGKNQELAPIQKLGYAERIIESFYVDTVDAGKMVEEGIIAMLKTLDPHSTYSNEQETKDLTTPLAGNFSGIGIQFNMLNDTLYVIQTTVGGPSERVGILAGDRILTANDSVLSGVKRKNSDILNILRGPKGTEVVVEVLRRNSPDPIRFKITRDDIPIYSVDASYSIDDSIGYIRVSRFAESTAREVAEALGKFKEKGIENIIVDLEDNGGGYLGAAVDMASLFLPKGSLVVYTDGPRIERTDYLVESEPLMPEGKLVVNVNQYSASSSEIFAGAIQDNDRGVIVGRRTFGKGLVQRPFPFPDGSMIRLTVSRYYTPSGRSIQKPYINGGTDDYYQDMYNRYKGGEFLSADSVHFADSLKVMTLRNARPVYGGGGIMPDLFVPVDTTLSSNYYRDMLANGVFNKFAINFVDGNRADLKQKYPDVESYITDFTLDEEMLGNLKETGDKEGVKFDEEGFQRSLPAIKAYVKGLIARDLWDMNEYFKVVNPYLSPIYIQSLGLIKDDTLYNSLLNPSTAEITDSDLQ